MPVLSNAKRQRLRTLLRDAFPNVSWTRAEADAAHQSIEDLLDNSASAFGSAIEGAVPGKFNAAQKTKISESVLALRLES